MRVGTKVKIIGKSEDLYIHAISTENKFELWSVATAKEQPHYVDTVHPSRVQEVISSCGGCTGWPAGVEM